MTTQHKKWHVDLEGMPHFDKAMERVYAWYEQEIIDRVPIRFFTHKNARRAACPLVRCRVPS